MAAYHTQIPPQFRWPGRYFVPAAQPSGDRSLYVGPLCRNGPPQLLRCIGKKVCGACQLSVGAGKHSLSTGSPQYGTVSLHLCAILLLCSLFLALGVQAVARQRNGRDTRRGKVFRTSFLLPMAIPVASIVIFWKVLFAKNGLVNGLICSLGGHAVDFMGTEAAFWVLVFTYVWKNAGYDMILWLAGLDGISADLYEAASVDGANAWQKFFYITLPNLLPTLTLVSVLSLLNSFKAFREAFLVGGNYPHESMYLLQHLFNNWFLSLDLPRLTAAAVLMALALSGLILALQRIWTRDK